MTTCDHGVCSFVACEECTAELDALKAEVERLRTFGDTIRLDILWQELVAERDQALTRVEVLEKKYTELREDYDAETDGRVKARARMAELEQECRDRQGTEDSLVAWNEEQATRIATLEAALREACFSLEKDDEFEQERVAAKLRVALAPPEATEGEGK